MKIAVCCNIKAGKPLEAYLWDAEIRGENLPGPSEAEAH